VVGVTDGGFAAISTPQTSRGAVIQSEAKNLLGLIVCDHYKIIANLFSACTRPMLTKERFQIIILINSNEKRQQHRCSLSSLCSQFFIVIKPFDGWNYRAVFCS
jgi:hypothetical protein